MRERVIEYRADIRLEEVIDVVIPRAIEAAGEQESLAAVEEREPRFMQNADLLDSLLSPRIVCRFFERLADRLFVTWNDGDEERELRRHPALRSLPLRIRLSHLRLSF